MIDEPSPPRNRTLIGLAALVIVLVVANLSRSTFVPGEIHLPFNVSLGLVAAGIAWATGMTLRELGLGRETLGSGLRFGGAAFALVAVVVGGAALMPSARDAMVDAGKADLTSVGLLVEVLLRIPIETVLVEELVFRGVLHGLLLRLVGPRAALAIGAGIFGLWHVFPEWRSTSDVTAAAGVSPVVAVFGTFVATSIAGVVFGWLRARSGSLVAPVLAHQATNSVGLVVAWLLAR